MYDKLSNCLETDELIFSNESIRFQLLNSPAPQVKFDDTLQNYDDENNCLPFFLTNALSICFTDSLQYHYKKNSQSKPNNYSIFNELPLRQCRINSMCNKKTQQQKTSKTKTKTDSQTILKQTKRKKSLKPAQCEYSDLKPELIKLFYDSISNSTRYCIRLVKFFDKKQKQIKTLVQAVDLCGIIERKSNVSRTLINFVQHKEKEKVIHGGRTINFLTREGVERFMKTSRMISNTQFAHWIMENIIPIM